MSTSLPAAAAVAASVLLCALGPASLAAAQPAPAPASSPVEASFRQLLADFDRFDRQADPITAGSNGDREALSRLPDDSPEALAWQTRELTRFKQRLAAIPAAALTPEDALNRDLLARTVDDRLEGLSFDEARMPFDSYSGFHQLMDELGQTHIRDRADADAWLSRLRAVPHFYAVNIANARRGVATGFVQPKPTAEIVLKVARAQAALPPDNGPFLAPFKSLPASIPAADQAALRAQALQVVNDQIKPAQRAFVTFMEQEYLPHARTSLAARDLPNGDAYYRYQVRHHTTTDLTPDQIHQIGLNEVARIRREMDAVIAQTGFKGSFQQFQAFLRTDPRFYPKSAEELLDKSSRMAKRIDDQLPHWFGRLPRLPFAVRPIPAQSAENATTAYYEPGSPTLGIAGGYMVNLTHLDQRPFYEMPALTLHEAEPGHHLQIALAQELTDLPSFRRDAYITAFAEGWGLYAEQLGVDMGIYQTPYEQFGRLSYEMWRACRLVADTGIHWLRWTRAQAEQCFVENTALAPKNIQVEVDRYISWPGQALAYKIGELKIMELRRRAEAALGPRFNPRSFHDAVLLAGPLPLDVLEKRVDAWIAAQKAG